MLLHSISQTQICHHWYWLALSGSNSATPKMYTFQFSVCWSLCWLNQIWAQQKEINLNSVQQGLWEFFLPPNSPCQLIKTLRLCWYLGQEHCRRVPNAPAGMGSDTLCHEESLPLIPLSRSLCHVLFLSFAASWPHTVKCVCVAESGTPAGVAPKQRTGWL